MVVYVNAQFTFMSRTTCQLYMPVFLFLTAQITRDSDDSLKEKGNK